MYIVYLFMYSCMYTYSSPLTRVALCSMLRAKPTYRTQSGKRRVGKEEWDNISNISNVSPTYRTQSGKRRAPGPGRHPPPARGPHDISCYSML